MSDLLTRREVLGKAPIALIGGGLIANSTTPNQLASASEPNQPAAKPPVGANGRLLLGFNTSTIRGQNLGIVREVDIAAQAGFGGIEPWVDEIDTYQKNGGSLPDLKKRIVDAGLKVESAIGFFEWVVDDEAQRSKGMEAAKKSMDLVHQIGGTRVAAPPVGATKQEGMDLRRIAERYRRLLEVGDEIGVVPQVEIWGFSKTLGRLSEAAYAAIEADHPKACILPDVYHLYRGGSSFSGIPLLGPSSIHVFHVNDYPATRPRQDLTDADRIFPGDGVAPLVGLLKDLRDGGFQVMLSLELFHREYWKQDPLAVAQAGYKKLQAVVDKSKP